VDASYVDHRICARKGRRPQLLHNLGTSTALPCERTPEFTHLPMVLETASRRNACPCGADQSWCAPRVCDLGCESDSGGNDSGGFGNGLWRNQASVARVPSTHTVAGARVPGPPRKFGGRLPAGAVRTTACESRPPRSAYSLPPVCLRNSESRKSN